jgi:hypothetical protein
VKNRRVAIAFAVFLAAFGVTALVIGLHDAALGGAPLGVTAGAVLLIAVGAFDLIAAGALLRLGDARCPQWLSVAFLLTALLGAYAFLAALKTGGDQRPIAAVIAGVVTVAAIVGVRVAWGDHVGTVEAASAAVIGVLGILIGIGEFWYQSQYVPSQLESAVSLQVHLRLMAVQKNFDVIGATIDFEDIGGRNVRVIGSTYSLTGSRVIRCERIATPQAVQHVFGGVLPDPQRSRFMGYAWEEQPAKVLGAGRFAGDGARLDANVAASRTLVFFVPVGDYQLLRFRAQLFAVSASIPLEPRLQDPKQKPLIYGNNLYDIWTVADSSWFHDLVYGRVREVITRYNLVDGPTRPTATPDINVDARFPNPTWSGGVPSEATLEKMFAGTIRRLAPTQPFADTELALQPPAEPQPGDQVPETKNGSACITAK